MDIDNKMFDTLQHKPIIGIIGGFTGWILGVFKNYMSNDHVLSGITILGTWIGVFIAVLTAIIKLVEFCKLVSTWSMQMRNWLKTFKKSN